MRAPPERTALVLRAQGVPLAAKVEALQEAACYPEPTRAVQAIETHMSWVFLTDRHAWKLKKPVRYGALDFRTLEARHFYCLEELRLNRRLAPSVYLDVWPLTLEADGSLRLGGAGTPADWLVQMRRLSAQDLLDALLGRRAAQPAHMQAIAARLAAFYRAQPRAAIDGRAYRALLLRHIEENEAELSLRQWELPAHRVRALCEQQRALVARHAGLFDARVAAGRVVEGHGDLRPEHVWLGDPLAIIDCLEFSPELRLHDAADEVAFLALECERAGAAPLAEVLLAAYRQASGDAVPPLLVHFYQGCRACVRARLAIAHLHERRYRADPRWRRRALRYLALAARHLRLAEPDAAVASAGGLRSA